MGAEITGVFGLDLPVGLFLFPGIVGHETQHFLGNRSRNKLGTEHPKTGETRHLPRLRS